MRKVAAVTVDSQNVFDWMIGLAGDATIARGEMHTPTAPHFLPKALSHDYITAPSTAGRIHAAFEGAFETVGYLGSQILTIPVDEQIATASTTGPCE